MYKPLKLLGVVILCAPLLASCSWEDSSLKRGVDSFTGHTQQNFSQQDSNYINTLNHVLNESKVEDLESVVNDTDQIHEYGKRLAKAEKDIHKATKTYKDSVDYKALDKDNQTLYHILVNTGEIYELTAKNLSSIASAPNITKGTFVKHVMNQLVVTYALLGNQYSSFTNLSEDTKKKALSVREQNKVLDLTYEYDGDTEKLAYSVGEEVKQGNTLDSKEVSHTPVFDKETIDKYKPVGSTVKTKAGTYNKMVNKYNKEVDDDMQLKETTEPVSKYTYNLLVTKYNGVIASYNDKKKKEAK